MSLPRQILILALALFSGGCVGALVMASAAMFVTYIPAGGTPQHSFVPSNLLYSPILAIFSVPVAMLAGFPTFVILRHLRILNWLSLSIVGAAASVLAAHLFGARFQSIDNLLVFAGAGIAAALVAYAVVLRSNIPLNRDAPQAARRLA